MDATKRFGNSVFASDFGNIHNLAIYSLSEVKNFVLAHELDFCLSPTYIKQEEVLAEFEVLIGQLQHQSLTSKTDWPIFSAARIYKTGQYTRWN